MYTILPNRHRLPFFQPGDLVLSPKSIFNKGKLMWRTPVLHKQDNNIPIQLTKEPQKLAELELKPGGWRIDYMIQVSGTGSCKVWLKDIDNTTTTIVRGLEGTEIQHNKIKHTSEKPSKVRLVGLGALTVLSSFLTAVEL